MYDTSFLVSILIPTYNRATIIGETLDSIQQQQYPHWECIIVDDGSTDATEKVVHSYTSNDHRFQYYHRPKNLPKGGNAARNYAFSKSRGEYIQWFDSDDLMTPDFLQKKVEVFAKSPELDFVVSRTMNFKGSEKMSISHYDDNLQFPLSLSGFLKKQVYFMTPDVLFKRESVACIKFDEHLRSAQETNFFIRFLAQDTLQGSYINETLTLRRIHPASIQQGVKKNHKQATLEKLLSYVQAFFSIQKKVDQGLREIMIHDLIMLFYHLKFPGVPLGVFLKFLLVLTQTKGVLKATAFLFAMVLVSIFNKGYNLVNYARS
ncbi:MAG: glycosyltransferase family 2 protein [Flavobacteriaceae bacterium]|nr:glycosyltransferase family 2 protein [Flavobacteriaceae bacterium]